MNQFLDVRTWLTATMIGLTGWLGLIATSSYNTLIDLSYEFKGISQNIITLTRTLETTNKNTEADIKVLQNVTDGLDKRLSKLEMRFEN